MLRSFLERFLYPLTSCQMDGDQRVRILGSKIIPAGVIFTMNSDPRSYEMMNYEFPVDEQKCYEMGQRLVAKAKEFNQ